jgi:hypothetical protein
MKGKESRGRRQSLAAIPLKNPNFSGLRLTRKIIPVEQKTPGSTVKAMCCALMFRSKPMELVWWYRMIRACGCQHHGFRPWPDSAIAANQVSDNKDARRCMKSAVLMLIVRIISGCRKETSASYVIRLNQPGDFRLPSTRAEVMYSPEIF